MDRTFLLLNKRGKDHPLVLWGCSPDSQELGHDDNIADLRTQTSSDALQ
jgi:hypothetical protein